MEERTLKCPGDPEVTASASIRWAAGSEADCPARQILDRVGDRWSMYVLAHLEAGPLRFNAIRRRITNLSQRVLTVTVRSLERDGLVTRTVYPTIPPQVDYRITPLGQSLLDAVQNLVVWSASRRDEIRAQQIRYDDQGVVADPEPAGTEG